ncbi:hypothetical protein [Streptomyces sp. NBC_00503]|uniref:hypothetical protein n=1 Tax=Streptomyces sp. NBC_00503 TaxID=2903659 RepID=UPI002E7FC95A|nr:hypothetical protein [Streptomyces sp. NBC_00503]WUD80381.1 hypothetical protein OG490_07335 [Streptomyces sp. NBC_00503]
MEVGLEPERPGRPEGSVWQLVRQGEPLGAVVVESADFPWLHGRFAPEAGFERVRSWFEAVQTLMAEETDDNLSDHLSSNLSDERFGERFDEAYAPIAEELTLLTPAGLPTSGFLLHIDGAEAWFRWSE